MGIKTKGPQNKRPGTKKGKAPHAKERPSHFDNANEYAPFSKTKVGGAAEGKVRSKSGMK